MSGMAATGIGAAQARIAEIQARLRSMSATTSVAGGVVGSGAAGTASARFDGMVSRAVGTTTSNAAPTAGAARTAASTTTSTAVSVPTGVPAGDWAARLPEAGRQWAGAIEEAATRNGVDPALLGALVWTESGFQADAVSHAGARGLAQLMPATAAGLGVDPDDPAQNLDGGARFLKAMLDQFGAVELGLAAYNAGPGRVAQAGGIPAIPETQAYVPKVLGHYAHLQGRSA